MLRFVDGIVDVPDADFGLMSHSNPLPRILVIDDLFGRAVPEHGNEQRADFCAGFRLTDLTGDQPLSMAGRVRNPVAEAIFYRGQKPVAAVRGDIVENDLDTILEKISEAWHKNRDPAPLAMVLLDLCFHTGKVTEASEREKGPGMAKGRSSDQQLYFGLSVLTALTERFPDLPVAILSSMPRADVAQEYIRRGAVGFLDKSIEDAAGVLFDLLYQHALVPDWQDDGKGIVGRTRALMLVLREARRAAAHNRPVLISGERGTGKEGLADYIRRHRDPTRPFVPVNCGGLSGYDSNMAFSAIFGHVRGAFAGAMHPRTGFVIDARGGILFLDEVSNLDLQVQAGLHRLLQEGEVAPLGRQERPIRVTDVKVLAASNSDLRNLTLREPPAFMPDLLDRLNPREAIELPPLRERLDDLPLLVERFVREAERDAGPKAWKGRAIDPKVFDYLRTYDWPGNVRELEQCIKGAVSTYKEMEILMPRAIPLPANDHRRRLTAVQAPVSAAPRNSTSSVELLMQLRSSAFHDATREDLYGHLNDVLLVLDAYLEQVLRLMARPSPEDPGRFKVNFRGSANWMLGSDSLEASQAKDLFKRLLDDPERNGLLTEFLKETLTKARESR